MSQQASFKKLKEQIEAAKRGLSDVSNAELADIPSLEGHEYELVPIAQNESAKIEAEKASTGNSLLGDAGCINVVNMMSKTVGIEPPNADNTFDQNSDESDGEFQFFHRTEQQKNSSSRTMDNTLEETSSVGSNAEGVLFEQLDRKLATLEEGVAQNRKHILELLSLLSQLELGKAPVNKKSQQSKRHNRRYMFWFMIGFLALAWFSLTPSGHTTIQHFLTFV